MLPAGKSEASAWVNNPDPQPKSAQVAGCRALETGALTMRAWASVSVIAAAKIGLVKKNRATHYTRKSKTYYKMNLFILRFSFNSPLSQTPGRTLLFLSPNKNN